MKSWRFSLFYPLWPAMLLLAGLMLALSMTSAQALPASPSSVDSPALEPGGVQGYLYPPLGTAQVPIEGGWIDIHDSSGEPWMGTATDENGYFEIPNLPSGDYVLEAYPPPGVPYAASLPAVVHVPRGDWVSETLHLTHVGISGWVQDCDTGDRLEGVPVAAHDEHWTIERWDETNVDGEFKIGGVATNTQYILEAFPAPESEYVPLEPLVVTPVTTNVALELCIPPTNVIGLVHNPAGDPVPGAGVVLVQGDFWRETAADDGGSFSFRGLPTGTLWIQAAPPWGPHGEGLLSSPPFSFTLSQPDGLVDVGVITLPKALKSASGQVVNAETGSIITQAVVVAHRLDEPGFADIPVHAASGAFTLSLPGGEWNLGVEPPPPPAPPPEWIFAGPPEWIAFQEPISVTEEITGVVLEVIPTNALVRGRVVCPGGTDCAGDPPPEQIWVELRNDDIHHGTRLQGDYSFALPIPDGWYELVVHVPHPFLQGPEPMTVFVGPNQELDVGEIELWPKDALIKGRVRNALGIGIADVNVVGWQPDGFGWGWTKTDASGFYTMPVIPGEWFVEPHPGPDVPYVYQFGPRQVRVAPHGTVDGVNFLLTRAGSRIEGAAVDANTFDRIWGLDGWAWAAQHPITGDFRPFSDAPLRDGAFELKVRGGYSYVVGLHLPPYADYVSGAIGPVPVPPESTVPVAVPLERKDAAIQGRLVVAGTSNPAIGAQGEVFGRDGRGNWAGVHVDSHSAEYRMEVVSGTWHMRAWVDPQSGYVAVPTKTVVTVQSGQTMPQDFEVWPIGASISGIVRQPNGDPQPGAFVFAEGKSPFVGYFEAFTKTNAAGFFELPVLDGVYAVGAALPRHELENQGWLNPPPIENVVATALNPAAGLDLQFRALDGLITGTISFAGPGVTPTHPAYVWGWSETGEWAETEAWVISGTHEFAYAMPVVTGTVWHVGAVYEDRENGYYYESPERLVDLRGTDQAQRDLVLGLPQPLPQPFIVSFDGSQMQTIIMPDGVELSIPPGSIVTSGTVTLFIFPTRELRPGKDREVVGVGYEIWAVDGDGQEITQFNQNVTLSFPYPPDPVLKALGINENFMVPVYYSTLVGRWILADSYTLDTNNNEITLQINHFTRFGSLSVGAKEFEIFLPVLFRDS